MTFFTMKIFAAVAVAATMTTPSLAQAPCTPCASGEPSCPGLELAVAGFLDTDSNCKSAQLANHQNQC